MAKKILGSGCVVFMLMSTFMYRPLLGFQVAEFSGSLLLLRRFPSFSYRTGEVVAFSLPSSRNLKTAQIVSVLPSGVITVKDEQANGISRALSPAAIQGKVVGQVALLGYPLAIVRTPISFLVLAFLFWVLFVWRSLLQVIVRGVY